MKAFFDSSVLVASFYGEHEHHEPSFALFLRYQKQNGCTAAHCLAEVYSVVTGMRGKDRASPQEALLYLSDVRDRLSIVTLDEGEYFQLLENVSAQGISGGAIYDAIAARCALKTEAETIYTWNIRDFTRLGEEVASRVRTP